MKKKTMNSYVEIYLEFACSFTHRNTAAAAAIFAAAAGDVRCWLKLKRNKNRIQNTSNDMLQSISIDMQLTCELRLKFEALVAVSVGKNFKSFRQHESHLCVL